MNVGKSNTDAITVNPALPPGVSLARLELRILFEETLARYPKIELAGTPVPVESLFLNQLKALPVRLAA